MKVSKKVPNVAVKQDFYIQTAFWKPKKFMWHFVDPLPLKSVTYYLNSSYLLPNIENWK